MFQNRVTFLISLVLIVSLLTGKANAGYTSEETDEKSKYIHSAVTSILDTTDTSKHHRKHTYDAAPCSSGGGCAVNVPGFILPASTPCSSPSGCPPLTKTTTYGNGIVYPSPSPNVVHGSIGVPQPPPPPSAAGYRHYTTGHGTPIASLPPPPPPPGVPAYGGYVYGHYPPQPTGQGAVPPPPQAGYGYSYGVPTGPAPPSLQAGYGYGYAGPTAPAAPPSPQAAYGTVPVGTPPHGANGAYGYHHYPGGRGHSVHNHSLKTKSEYTEVGTHSGPLQQANGGYGYGSGYGGYNGMFNRPGF
ncbi:uncharacterized protein [Musca autumnalis]|uniref:uncharacterized protein n=1 Tax=Musca autumnalis TaxID=221902 RepID=UPI003CF1E433